MDATTKRRGRPPTDPAVIAVGVEIMATGKSPQDAAEELAQRGVKVSWRTLHEARAKALADGTMPAPPRTPEDVPEDAIALIGNLDASADPLAIMRQLLQFADAARAKLKPDHPRYNALLTNAGSFAKSIAVMERERAKVETPEELENRRRREAGETRRKLLEYVEQAEAEAATKGVCAHCGAPRANTGTPVAKDQA